MKNTVKVLSLGFVGLCSVNYATDIIPKEKKQETPNIILILADDLGWKDLSCMGGTAVKTPNIDRIAKSGILFTGFRAAAAVCTPSRGAILTGRYPFSLGITRHFGDRSGHLSSKAVAFPKLLQNKGYYTAHVGKWHLGGLSRCYIEDRKNNKKDATPGILEHGFNYYLSQNEELVSHRTRISRKHQLYRRGGECLLENDKFLGKDNPYYKMFYTDINGTKAIELLEQFHKKKEKFFLNLWFVAPHTPFEPAPEPHWSNTAAKGISKKQHRFRSMVARMDYQIGRLLDKLKEYKMLDNTLILFSSDNGGAYEGDIGKLKGGKTDLHDGGLRVPLIISWKGHLPAGKVINQFCTGVDIMPTLCAAAEIIPPKNINGINLLPYLLNNKPLPKDRTVYWELDLYRHLQRYYPKPKPYSKEVIRSGEWKLLAFNGVPVELFHISEDPYEKKNLLKEQPERVHAMLKQLKTTMAKPRLDAKYPSGKR